MAYSLKEQLSKEERFVGGHRLCAGCGAGITVRAVLRALEPEDKAVITNGNRLSGGFLLPVSVHRIHGQLHSLQHLKTQLLPAAA